MIRIFFLLIFTSTTLFAQSGDKTANVTDSKGQKQGFWKVYYPGDSIVRYTGQFKDDKPFGDFVFHDGQGEKQVIMHYRTPEIATAENFFPGGALMATGKYVNKQKDSTWKYFDPSGALLSVEHYIEGRRYGTWKTYYPNGNILEEKYYENGQENGPYVRRYNSGLVFFEATYVDGALEGDATYYHENGMVESEGKYHRDAKEGYWKVYNEKGELVEQIPYVKGVAQGRNELISEDSLKYYKKDRVMVDEIIEEDFSKVPTKEEEKKSKKEGKK